jgi:methionyl-tRNA formyltransferase
MRAQPSAVKTWAQAHDLPLAQPASLRSSEAHALVRDFGAEVMVVAAYGLLLPQAILDLPRWGCLNIHASLLPRWRGAAPIQRAIEAGDECSGITIMRMEAGLDTGPTIAMHREPIQAHDTSATLQERLASLGAQAIVDVLERIAREAITASPASVPGNSPDWAWLAGTPQPAQGVCYAAKIQRAQAQIDWRLGADEIERRIRAFDPAPGAFTCVAGEVLKIWRAQGDARGVFAPPGTVLVAHGPALEIACGRGRLAFLEVQRAGARRLAVADFLQGFPLAVGTVLESPPLAEPV